MKTRYKVLNSGMKSPFQEFEYKIGANYSCNNFDTDHINDCSTGFYATGVEGILYSNLSNSKKVYECEVSGPSVEIDQFKMRYKNIKIIREVGKEELQQLIKKYDENLSYNLFAALFPLNPLSIKSVLSELDKKKLVQWASVGAPVWDSVWDSVCYSVGYSVGNSVWTSVWASVGASVRDSVWASVGNSVRDSVWDSMGPTVRDSMWASVRASVGAYTSYLFPEIKKWEYIRHKKGDNPFQSCIDLWERGFVPSFDGKMWRLHSGQNAEIVYEWEKI